MARAQENLNISYNFGILIREALRRFETQEDAAQALGISSRTLIRYKKMYQNGTQTFNAIE